MLEGKTPYEMINKRKPHLGGIQEFGAAAYVKDLKAGNWMPEHKSVDLLVMILSLRGIGFTGLENGQ